ncbi:MAG: hypothetical protein K1X74_02945 [Pirellulales bacterium]|nr:hypothetical protein [Pirellulales bacterium]
MSWRITVAFFALLVSITLLRAAVITSPPYFDFALGIFREAGFLYETNFDVLALRNQQGSTIEGYDRAYVTSIVPSVVALLWTLGLGTTATLATYHLSVFAATAAMTLGFFGLLRDRVPGWLAAVLCFALLTTPILSTQVDMLGLEIFITACAVWTARCVARERYAQAALVGTLAFFIKPTGALITAATIATLCCLLAAGWRSAAARRLAWGLGWNVLALACQIGVFRWGGSEEIIRSHHAQAPYLLALLALCPDVLLLMALAAVLLFVELLGWLFSRGAREPLPAALHDRRVALFFLLLAVAVPLMVVIYARTFAPRYHVLSMPALYMLFAAWAGRSTARTRVLAGLASAVVAFNLVNWNGALLVEITPLSRHASTLERSHEYLADHESNIRAIRLLASAADDTPLLVFHPFTHFVTYPRLGYVDRPLRGYSVSPFISTNIVPASQLLVDLPAELRCFEVDNIYYYYGLASLPERSPDSPVLYDDHLPSPLVIYRAGPGAAATTSEARRRWYLEQCFLGPADPRENPERALLRARVLHGSGLVAAAAELLELASVRHGEPVDLELALASYRVEQGQFAAAEERLQRLLGKFPNSAAVQLELNHVRALRTQSGR